MKSEFSLEEDIKNCEWIKEKIRSSDQYACNLYASMCNRYFIKDDVMTILKEAQWSVTWRTAGRIVGDITNNEYLYYYGGGNEGILDPEIEMDLRKLGWSSYQMK